MRGTDRDTGKLFSYTSPESLVPQDHPLRAIRALVNAALDRLSPTFAWMYAEEGRPSILAERLLRALLLQALFTIREEVFGWIKTVGGLRKTRHRGTALVGWMMENHNGLVVPAEMTRQPAPQSARQRSQWSRNRPMADAWFNTLPRAGEQ
jgi:hypothetical protein